jgi:ATP-binding protein involved in chromosome partitioning
MVQIHKNVDDAQKQKKAQAEQDASVHSSLKKIKKKFVVLSGKGGVGKTSTSVNLAMALAKKGFDVGIKSNKLDPMRYSDNLKAISIESLIASKDDAVIWRGPLKYSAIRQFIGEVEWGDLDFLIIDSPPGTGDEPLTVAQTISDAQAIIVTTPQEVALADVRKSINFCRTLKMDIFGLIENMSGFTCPHCNKMVELFGTGGGEKTARETGIQFLGRIPFDPNFVSCGDNGISFQEKYTDSQITKVFAEIAEKLSK